MTPSKQADKLDVILHKAFNDHYDYITEADIIKVAHEYSEKTIYKRAKAAIQAYARELCLKARIEELTDFNPLVDDHRGCPGIYLKGCMGYGNAHSDFFNEKGFRLDELRTELDNLTTKQERK